MAHFALSGRVEKFPLGPITSPNPGPTLATAVAAPVIAVIRSNPQAPRMSARTANVEMKRQKKPITDVGTSSGMGLPL